MLMRASCAFSGVVRGGVVDDLDDFEIVFYFLVFLVN
jgi:hypothetical protein